MLTLNYDSSYLQKDHDVLPIICYNCSQVECNEKRDGFSMNCQGGAEWKTESAMMKAQESCIVPT